ncbi:MAG: stringent starvation protein B [Halothiobacillus sp.]
MLSKRPYLIRALYDWTVDQGHVPIIVVDATVSGVTVPQAHVDQGQIHLNISPSAVRNFSMDRRAIAFEARFAGKPEAIFVPIRAVIGIYDRDFGSGAQFPPEPDEEFMDDDEPAAPAPKLSLAGVTAPKKLRAKPSATPSDEPPQSPTQETPDDEPPPNAPAPKGARLRIVK